MKIAIIHAAASGFFPRFYNALRKSIIKHNSTCTLFLPNIKTNRNSNLPDKLVYGTRLNKITHTILYKITGLQDIFSLCDTLLLIYKLRKYQPDIIHLHIVNDKFLNLSLLINYVNKTKIPLVWTMHDCRTITGRCAYFDEIGCDRWKIGCGRCPQKELYEPTWIDNSHLEWMIKQKILTSIKNLTIVTPSLWLANVVSSSLLKTHRCKVINNGVNPDIFQNRTLTGRNQIINDYHLEGRMIVLGVASAWEERKGFKEFIKLAEDLPDEYTIILVGDLPYKIKNVISIPRTNSIAELTALYDIADVFVNPTMADNFPTTNIEALAMGTPVVTYNSGGSGEAISMECGIVVERGNYDSLKKAVIEITTNKEKYTKKACLNRAKLYSTKKYDEYCKLYTEVL